MGASAIRDIGHFEAPSKIIGLSIKPLNRVKIKVHTAHVHPASNFGRRPRLNSQCIEHWLDAIRAITKKYRWKRLGHVLVVHCLLIRSVSGGTFLLFHFALSTRNAIDGGGGSIPVVLSLDIYNIWNARPCLSMQNPIWLTLGLMMWQFMWCVWAGW